MRYVLRGIAIIGIVVLQMIFLTTTVRSQFISSNIEIGRLISSSDSVKLENAIRKLAFVRDLKIDLVSSSAAISFKTDQDFSMNKLMQQIHNAGFCPVNTSCVYSFKNSKVVVFDTIMLNHEVYYFLRMPAEPLVKETTFRFIGDGFSEKDSILEWRTQMEVAKRKYPHVKSSMYFVLL